MNTGKKASKNRRMTSHYAKRASEAAKRQRRRQKACIAGDGSHTRKVRRRDENGNWVTINKKAA